MAIYTPKNKNFELASMWYDSHDNRMSDREKESVMAHMPKEAYDKMVDNYKSSFPEENSCYCCRLAKCFCVPEFLFPLLRSDHMGGGGYTDKKHGLSCDATRKSAEAASFF